jgi:hypothetical protein
MEIQEGQVAGCAELAFRPNTEAKINWGKEKNCNFLNMVT